MLMDMNNLKQINQIQQLTKDTVEALTEPIQPIYLMLKPEQYNLLAENISTIGNAIVRNTDLISELPTQEGLEEILTNEVRYRMFRIEDIVKNGQKVMTSSVEDKLSKQTESLMKAVDRKISEMVSDLKSKNKTPLKLKLKWILTGAALPSILLILQLILR